MFSFNISIKIERNKCVLKPTLFNSNIESVSIIAIEMPFKIIASSCALKQYLILCSINLILDDSNIFKLRRFENNFFKIK